MRKRTQVLYGLVDLQGENDKKITNIAGQYNDSKVNSKIIITRITIYEYASGS